MVLAFLLTMQFPRQPAELSCLEHFTVTIELADPGDWGIWAGIRDQDPDCEGHTLIPAGCSGLGEATHNCNTPGDASGPAPAWLPQGLKGSTLKLTTSVYCFTSRVSEPPLASVCPAVTWR